MYFNLYNGELGKLSNVMARVKAPGDIMVASIEIDAIN
jgi:hypothetical protein